MRCRGRCLLWSVVESDTGVVRGQGSAEGVVVVVGGEVACVCVCEGFVLFLLTLFSFFLLRCFGMFVVMVSMILIFVVLIEFY